MFLFESSVFWPVEASVSGRGLIDATPLCKSEREGCTYPRAHWVWERGAPGGVSECLHESNLPLCVSVCVFMCARVCVRANMLSLWDCCRFCATRWEINTKTERRDRRPAMGGQITRNALYGEEVTVKTTYIQRFIVVPHFGYNWIWNTVNV